MAARTEQNITVFATGIPSQEIHLWRRNAKRTEGDSRMGAQQAEFVQETVPGEESGGEFEAQEEKEDE